MNNKLKVNKGITLIALVITVIILIILAGVSIATINGTEGNIFNSKKAIDKTQLNKIQEVVFENYIKYKQTSNERFLKGIQMTYNDAKSEFDTLGSTQNLKISEYNENDPGTFYYKLQNWHLKELGLENINNDEYIVNYSTGEVFNITTKTTEDGEILYIYK